jgi:hypothetical protein
MGNKINLSSSIAAQTRTWYKLDLTRAVLGIVYWPIRLISFVLTCIDFTMTRQADVHRFIFCITCMMLNSMPDLLKTQLFPVLAKIAAIYLNFKAAKRDFASGQTLIGFNEFF